MTIDERLDRLTERHEALSHTVELVEHQIQEVTGNVDRLASMMGDLMTVVKIHQGRLDRLEDQR